jgi:hypothetical protein
MKQLKVLTYALMLCVGMWGCCDRCVINVNTTGVTYFVYSYDDCDGNPKRWSSPRWTGAG